MPDDKPFAPRNWLPHLTGGSRITFSQPDVQESAQATAVVEPEFAPEDATTMTEPTRSRDHLLSQDWASELESQFGLTTSEQAPTVASDVASHEEGAPAVIGVLPVNESIGDLKERLSYYEHFDALIRDNISRSAELFQAVFTEREKSRTVQAEAETAMSAVASEAERRIETQRSHVSNLLMALMDEATDLRQRSDSLIQRLAQALTEIAPQADEDDEPVSGA